MRIITISPDAQICCHRTPDSPAAWHSPVAGLLGGPVQQMDLGTLCVWTMHTPTRDIDVAPNPAAGLLLYQLLGQVRHLYGPVALTGTDERDLGHAAITWLLRTLQLAAGQKPTLDRLREAAIIHRAWLSGTSTTPTSTCIR